MRKRQRPTEERDGRAALREKKDLVFKLMLRLGKAEDDEAASKADPLSIFTTFPTQAEAFARADAEAVADVETLSLEDATGRRKFLVASKPEFLRRFMLGLPHERHYYEIIRAARPCHLYLDLEFKRAWNATADGDGAVRLLVAALQRRMVEDFGVHVPDDAVVDFTSSTPTKFSRHVILRAPGHLWTNNRHAGEFMRRVLDSLRPVALAAQPGTPEWALFPLADAAGARAFIADMGVYTRNRAFRTYGSCKYGRKAVLSMHGVKHGDAAERDCLLRGMVSAWIPAAEVQAAKLLECAPAAAAATTARRSAALLASTPGTQETASMVPGTEEPHGEATLPASAGNDSAVSWTSGRGASPVPEADRFAAACLARGGGRGTVRLWRVRFEAASSAAKPVPCALVLEVAGNKYCARIGRQHKSNHVFLEIDFRTLDLRQGCHDRDCSGFRSTPTRLPDIVADAVGHFVQRHL